VGEYAQPTETSLSRVLRGEGAIFSTQHFDDAIRPSLLAI
jgi:hypothetical protein